MTEEVHFIPVGFDFQRLVQPLSRDEFNPDRVVLFYSKRTPDREKEAELAQNMVDLMEGACNNVLDATVDVRPLTNIFDYADLFKDGYRYIEDELNSGNEVHGLV